MNTDITIANLQYNENKSNWQMVRDIVKGESALKRHDLNNVKKFNTVPLKVNNYDLNRLYLPMPNPDDCSERNTLRYCQYVQRASLFGATSRTEDGMAGMVFSKPGVSDLPENISYLNDDADGSDIGIQQQSSEVLRDILETGNEGLLVDYPQTDGETTQAEAEEQGVRASISIYKAESIFDWQVKKAGAKSVLSMVKLGEVREVRTDIFNVEYQEIIRVLILNDDGNYEVQIYENETNEPTETFVPLNAQGQPFKYIPFFFVGAVNNRPGFDKAPLLTLAEVNLAHYRNSADFEESEFITGQPTLVITGLDKAWADKYMANGVGFGARGGIPLGKDSDAKMLQPEPNSMPELGMNRKERQMVELGARLIQPGGAAETAEAARIKHASDASIMTVVVENITLAYRDAIVACQEFNGSAGQDFEFSMNMDFFETKLTPQEVTALVATWQQRAISKDVLDAKLKSGGIIDEDVDLEVMNAAIDETPVGINFDG